MSFSVVLDKLTDVTNTIHTVTDIYYLLIPEISAKFEVTKELTTMKSLCEITGQNIFKEVEKTLILYNLK